MSNFTLLTQPPSYIAYIMRCTAIKNCLPDVQRDPPSVRLAVDKVCVHSLRVKVCLKSSNNSVECQPGTVSACVDVHEGLRGIHVSRSVEAVLKTINSVTHLSLADIQHSLKAVAESLLMKHEYSSKASVKLRLELFYTMVDTDTIPVTLTVSVRLGMEGSERYSIGIAFEGMSVCPCAQQVYAFLENTHAPHTPSHSQRALLSIRIDSPTLVSIEVSEVVKALLSAFSAPVKSFLKRDEEYRLVKRAFENPKFAEDIAREAMYVLYKAFQDRLSPRSRIAVKVLSFESVHPFNLYAEIRRSVEELSKAFSSGEVR